MQNGGEEYKVRKDHRDMVFFVFILPSEGLERYLNIVLCRVAVLLEKEGVGLLFYVVKEAEEGWMTVY